MEEGESSSPSFSIGQCYSPRLPYAIRLTAQAAAEHVGARKCRVAIAEILIVSASGLPPAEVGSSIREDAGPENRRALREAARQARLSE
jgi:hypothetical protein